MRSEFYRTQFQRKQFLDIATRNGETMIHDNFLPNGRKELVFDILPPDQPDPNRILLKLLLEKLQNNTITFEQLKTLIRLEHGFELTQTTRDKILIAVQGIVGTLTERIRNAFNL